MHAGQGVRMNYLDYWCDEMLDSEVEETKVRVRYDPFDVSIGYAYIDGKWRECKCPIDEFVGCSERELSILSEELRMRKRVLYGREQVEITQKQLAEFRRRAESKQALLQQQKDRETRAAFEVLEGTRGKRTSANASLPSPAKTSNSQRSQISPPRTSSARTTSDGDNLIILRRYR